MRTTHIFKKFSKKFSKKLCKQLGIALILTPLAAHAEPIWHLNSGADFHAAIQNNSIRGYDPSTASLDATDGLIAVYGSSSIFKLTTVSATPTANGMSSNVSEASSGYFGGAYSLVKGPDPDYTDFIADLTFNLDGTNVDTISFDAIDINKNVEYWKWDSSALSPSINTFDFNISDGLGSSHATLFHMDTSFDITHVSSLQIAFSGQSNASGGLTLRTNNIGVVPEPGAYATAGIGLLLGMANWRLRRKHKS